MYWLARSIPPRLAACLAVCVCSLPARGEAPPLRFIQSAPTPQQPEPIRTQPDERLSNWHVQVELMARFTAPAGEIRLPGGSSRGSLVELADLDIDAPRLMPGFDISVRDGAWRFNAIGLFYDIDDRTALAEQDLTLGRVFVAEGQRSSVSHTYTQLDFRVARTILDRALSPRFEGQGHRVRVRVDAEVGLRIYDFEFDVENLDTGDRATDDRTFFEPHAGFKGALNVFENATVDLYTNFGAWPFDAAAFSWDIGIGFQWRPIEHLGVQIGYRSTIFRLNEGSGDNEFEWNGSYQGLYAGLQFRF